MLFSERELRPLCPSWFLIRIRFDDVDFQDKMLHPMAGIVQRNWLSDTEPPPVDAKNAAVKDC